MPDPVVGKAGTMVVDAPSTGPRPQPAGAIAVAQDPPPTQRTVDRSSVIGEGLKATASWSLRIIIIGVATALALWLLGRIWVGVLPVILALIVTTVLWGPVAWLRRKRFPPALAAACVLVGFLAVVAGVVTLVARPVVDQSVDVVNRASDGLVQVQQWLAGPPVNLASEQIDQFTATVVNRLQSSASQIASGVFSGVSAVTSAVVTTLLVLVLTFFFLKDGQLFLPWLRRETGRNLGGHLTEVLARIWKTLGDFIRVQAIVSGVDAVLIGLGLVLLGVPLAPALAVLTFVAGFVPIIGAVTAGALAVLLALVSNGWTTALAVLGLILLVQQLESNVLQPVLQGRSLRLHAGIVLLAVTAGGTLFGITGAFLAVPMAASVVTALRYMSEQISLRTGELTADDLALSTSEGAAAARRGEQQAQRFRRLFSRRPDRS